MPIGFLTRSQRRFLTWLFYKLGLGMSTARPAFQLLETLEPRQMYSITPLASAFQVDSGALSANVMPQMAVASGTGNFVVAWAAGTGPVLNGDIEFVLHDATGGALTAESVANTGHAMSTRGIGTNLPSTVAVASLNQSMFDVAMDAAGDFVVAWQGASNIYAQRFDATGLVDGAVIVVSTAGNDAHVSSPSVAMDAAGDFAVTWLADQAVTVNVRSMMPSYSSQFADSDGHITTNVTPVYVTVTGTTYTASAVFARRFDANDVAGTVVQVTSDAPVPAEPSTSPDTSSPSFLTALNPKVAMDAAGDFAVAWDSESHAPIKVQAYPSTSHSGLYYVAPTDPYGHGHYITLHYSMAATFTYYMNANSRGIQTMVRRFDAGNALIGTAIAGSAKTGAIIGADLDIAMDDAGDFAILSNLQYDPVTKTKVTKATAENAAYTTRYYATSSALTMQRFNAAKQVLSTATTVAKAAATPAVTTGHSIGDALIRGTSIAMDGSAGTLVAWDQWSYDKLNFSEVDGGIFAVRYNAAGTALDTAKAPIVSPADGDVTNVEAVFIGSGIDIAFQQSQDETHVMVEQFHRPLAELSASIGNGTLPPAFVGATGANGTVPVVVTNNGDLAASGSVVLSVAFSTDNMFGNGDDAEVTSKTFTMSLAPGKSTTLTLTMALPAGLPEGEGFLVAHVAPAGTTASFVESDAANNSAASPLLVAGSDVQNLAVISVVPKLPGTVLVPGDKTTVGVQLRNFGTQVLPANTLVVVDIYGSANGLVDGAAVKIGTLTTKQTLKPGAVANVTVPVTITDAMAAGSYFFVAHETAATLTESDPTDDAHASAATTVLVWQVGQVAGRTGLVKFVETPAAGKTVTYSLTGAGTGTFTDGGDGTKNLTLANTTAATTVTAAVAGGDLKSTLHSVSDSNAIKSFSAPGLDLGTDATFAAGITTLTLRDVAGSHTITLGGAGTGTGTTLTFHQVADLLLTSTAPIAALKAIDWTATDPLKNGITAPVLNKLTIAGDKAHGVAGNFAPSMTLAGSGSATVKQTLGAVSIAGQIAGGTWQVTKGTIASIAAKGAAEWSLAAPASAVGAMTFSAGVSGEIDILSSTGLTVKGDLSGTALTLEGTGSTLTTVSVTGQMLDSTVRSNGNIGAVTLGAMRDSMLFAGVNGTVMTLPTDVADFSATRKISSVTIKGVPGDTTAQFVNSNIAATNLGAMKLGKVDTLNLANSGAAFGVAFRGPATTAGLASLSYSRFPDSAAVSVVIGTLLPGANMDGAQTIQVL